ncbi:MAG TPA: cob(I)yrinic acid a,c-diamide adenosyltransferase [Thermopetrobacter sp.]|nr:cob(I)yrinic acid a,c-diamide adenosyltransferase [Thermopetrobacter sp.]
MVKLNRIYTRTGDAGDSGLADGSRLPKHHPRFAAIGDVDETNAAIGLARLHVGTDDPHGVAADLAAIQNDLFDLGADLATPQGGQDGEGEALRIVSDQVAWLERRIDALNALLQPLTSFVLPAGSAAAAHLHHARTVCRRAERAIARLAAEEDAAINPHALAYANRLSDYLFVAARVLNGAGAADVLWRPAAGRDRERGA